MKKVVIAICLLIFTTESCSWLKDEKTGVSDYFPIRKGAKYRYNYSVWNRDPFANSRTKGESFWETVSGSDTVFVVQETFNGYTKVIDFTGKVDSISIKDRLSTWTFIVGRNGEVNFSWRSSHLSFQRLKSSNQMDTCFYDNEIRICLRKDVGIQSLGYYDPGGNYSGGADLTLIEGPFY